MAKPTSTHTSWNRRRVPKPAASFPLHSPRASIAKRKHDKQNIIRQHHACMYVCIPYLHNGDGMIGNGRDNFRRMRKGRQLGTHGLHGRIVGMRTLGDLCLGVNAPSSFQVNESLPSWLNIVFASTVVENAELLQAFSDSRRRRCRCRSCLARRVRIIG